MTLVLESLNNGLRRCLEDSPDVYLIGEDLLDPYGGAFKAVRGLSSQFPGRVISTPVSEAGIVGVGVGMALRGLRPVVEIMFGDFLTLAADQLINHAAKFRWMSGGEVMVPLVVRSPMGGYRGYGPTHSQSLEKHFLGVPGLRVIALNAIHPPEELLARTVLESDDPVLLIEHKLLYPQPLFRQGDELELTSGKGHFPWSVLQLAGAPPAKLTLIAYGYMAEMGREAMLRLAYEHELFCELLVPTQLSPFNLEPLYAGAAATRAVLTIEEGSLDMGWGAEITARLAERLGTGVRTQRVAARNSPIPAAPGLEADVLPQVNDIMRAAMSMVRG